MIENWRPSASFEALKTRAELLNQIRQFFASRGIWEVSTPILSAASITDPNIDSLQTRVAGGVSPKDCYLHTSPEFPMKRLLAAGSGAIYQICTVFRDGEQSRRHNPEFTMLEWYRPGYDHHRLMDEVEDLLKVCLPDQFMETKAQRISYRDAFLQSVNLNPYTANIQQCLDCCKKENIPYPDSMANSPDQSDKALDSWLDLILSHRVAASFAQECATFLYDYPATQAALATTRIESDYRVASRFEVFWGELELANGFHELKDADEQQRRFEKDNQIRMQYQKTAVNIDDHLIRALYAGLPDCAGVALGLDRLLMVLLGKSHIRDVLAFPFDRA